LTPSGGVRFASLLGIVVPSGFGEVATTRETA
jgi:hypothetical protein